MKIADVNLLLYAIDSDSPQHARTRPWLEERLSGSETFAFTWATLVAFIRLATNPHVFTKPLTVDEAMDHVDTWLAQPAATVIAPTNRHAALLRDLLGPLGAAGNLTNDAHLAALSIEHGAELCSADADFSRFPRLRWVNPLAVA